MINPDVIGTARLKLGEYLRDTRVEQGLSHYAVAKKAGLRIEQVQALEAGAGYTIDKFLALTHALDCYLFLATKDGKHLDFVDMAEKAKVKKPD